MTTDLLRQGRYQIEQPLGRGGMGTVHLARDTVLGRLVAVKVLADHLAADDAFRRRFLQEARLTARLCHPNIVQVFDAGDDGCPFLVMEYVDGETIAHRLARGAAFSGDEALTLAVHLAGGLAHAHARGIVHRDVKPHNILLRQDGVAKLTDFGIARALEESGLTEFGTAVGTARFMAPEQAGGGEVGPPADVYGMGAVLRHIGGDSLPPELEAVTEACLAPEPAARPTAADLYRRLTELVGMPAGLEAPTPMPAPPLDAAPTELAVPAPTQIAPAEVWPTPATPVPGTRSPAGGRAARLGWPAIAAAAVLLMLLALFVPGRGGADGDSADAPTVTPVPTAPDAASSARSLANWLREQSD
ncbi:MAG TPA: protein kinase [Acidimicrobiia bacterium]|nr:protein kinase [Acidimicrobiia bacterium]